MKIFIDTADIEEIKEAFSWGIVDGVTTNPSLIKKAVDSRKKGGGGGGNGGGNSNRKDMLDMENYIKDILETAERKPVSLEVIGLTEEKMYEEAKHLYKKFNSFGNVVIKIPINPFTSESENKKTAYDGLKTINKLTKDEIPVNCTLIMTPEQALLAAKAGARYVSPFAGRIDDYLREPKKEKFGKSDYYPEHGKENRHGEIIDDKGIVSGVDLVKKTVQIFRNYNFNTEIIASSTRNPRQVREIALTGAHIATIPFDVLEEMLYHEKTKNGVKKFTEDIVDEYRKIFEK